MTTIQLTGALLIDVTSEAQAIEEKLAEYLLPEPSGYWLPNASSPVLKAGQYYFQLIDGVETRIAEVQEIKGDVYNHKHDVVVSKSHVKYLSPKAQLPVRGMEVVRLSIDHILDSNAIWTKSRYDSMFEAAAECFDPVLFKDSDFKLHNKIASELNLIMANINTAVLDFIAGNEWMMHFQRKWLSTSTVIEKTIDYRVWCWEQEHGEAFRKGLKR